VNEVCQQFCSNYQSMEIVVHSKNSVSLSFRRNCTISTRTSKDS